MAGRKRVGRRHDNKKDYPLAELLTMFAGERRDEEQSAQQISATPTSVQQPVNGTLSSLQTVARYCLYSNTAKVEGAIVDDSGVCAGRAGCERGILCL